LKRKTISIVIVTYNAEKTIFTLLSKIDFSKYKVFIIDSSSIDNTLKICKKFNCIIKTIDKSEFNHGATRELGRGLSNSDIVVHLTQDAIPKNLETINTLIKPLINEEVSIAYARQIPRDDANLIESLLREYNYPSRSQIRSIEDKFTYGVYTFFCSDSCAAWSNKALDSIGGIKPTLTNEDYFSCAELLIKGHKIAYVSDAEVIHSHKYSLKEEFQRMFDTGYVRAKNPWIQDAVGKAGKRGKQYLIFILRKIWVQQPTLIPYAIIQTIVKYLGYSVGYHSKYLSPIMFKYFSSQKYYWDSKYYDRK